MSYVKSLKQEPADLNKPSGHKTERYIMKRTTLVLILLAVLVVSCLMLTACQPSDPTTGPSSEHSCEFGEWTVIKQPTCTETGLKVQVCECGESRTEIIPATGHGYKSVVTDSPCIGGYTTHTCSACGDSFVDIDAETYGEHNFQQSDTCEHCGQNIVDVAVENYKHSYLDVKYYVVPRIDGKYDAYIKGTGWMPDNSNSGGFFYGEGKIVSIYISDGITDIGEWAFNNCIGLTSIVIPDSVTTIGCCAFQDCINLTNIVIPDSVTRIDARAFWGCSSLTSIDIPEGVTSIGDYTFSGCKSLTSIKIPDSVTNIGDGAFSGCSSLRSIEIPDSVTSIDYGAFV